MTNILSSGKRTQVEVQPFVSKYVLQLTKPEVNSNQADLERLLQQLPGTLGHVRIPLLILQKLPRVLRAGDWQVTLTIAQGLKDCWLVDVVPGRHEALYGLAVDIGTTTVVVSLVNLNTGVVEDTASNYNGQVGYGDAILSRIYVASQGEGLQKLQQAVVSTINDLINQLMAKHSLEPNEVSAMTVAGNTTMTHLFLGLDPENICKEPYLPVINSPGFNLAQDIGVVINPLAPIYCLPNVGSYVGGDIIAGVLVSGMHLSSQPALFVDVGTNGEIVFGSQDWLVTCAGAAGPALESGVAEHGMRAESGAIAEVLIDKVTREIKYSVIDGQRPKGICGSGLIDCVAQMLLAGIIDRSGRFKGEAEEFVIVPEEKSATGQAIIISQKDVRSLLRTKAAVTAAVEVLFQAVGFDGLPDCLFAAGAFGTYVNPESAVTIGLYPDLPRDRIISLGNSSLEGARVVLLSRAKLLEAEGLAQQLTYIELNNNEEFMNRYSSGLFLPHMDLEKYPSVKAKLFNG